MKWKTKKGEIIDIPEMDDSHLINTAIMLKRKGFIHSDNLLRMFKYLSNAPDMAAMAAEEEIYASKTSKVADAIFDELDKRNIKY